MFGYKSKQEYKKKMRVESILYTSDRIMNSKTQIVFVKF